MIDKDIFEDLFVLEMANNHLGKIDRGLKIINEFAQVVIELTTLVVYSR